MKFKNKYKVGDTISYFINGKNHIAKIQKLDVIGSVDKGDINAIYMTDSDEAPLLNNHNIIGFATIAYMKDKKNV